MAIVTVADLIDDLKGHSPDAKIGFCTDPASDLEVLSIYGDGGFRLGDRGYREYPETIVWVDLGEREE